MSKFALIGNPVSHSQSPALFRAAYGAGPDSYSLIAAPTCAAALRQLREGGFAGANVTSPFKDEIMESVAFPDRISRLLGSANTLLLEDDGIHAFNTDYYGVKDTLENRRLDRAMVIGAGGAGKAAALACTDLGMEVVLANRSAGKAEPFARKIGAVYAPLEDIGKLLPQTDLLIHCLSIPLPVLQGNLLEGKVIFEANYAHPHLQGLPCREYIGGRHWLYHQAIGAFIRFTGKTPDTGAMRSAIGL